MSCSYRVIITEMSPMGAISVLHNDFQFSSEEECAMEYIFILIAIAIFISVLTGDLGYLLFGATGFLLILSGLLVIIFLICSVLLLMSKRKEARFLRVDLPSEEAKYKVAYYLVEGEEIPCLFPEEGVFRKKLYRTDKTYHVLLNKKLGRVFDRFAVATCILGLVCGTGLGTVLLLVFI